MHGKSAENVAVPPSIMAASRLAEVLPCSAAFFVCCFYLLCWPPPPSPKNKNKSALPEDILRAQTVRVVIDPDAGEPMDQPKANAIARENVEKALEGMGPLPESCVLDGAESDLIISVRTGNGRIDAAHDKGGPIDNVRESHKTTDSTFAIGGQRGHPPHEQSEHGPAEPGPPYGQ